MTIHEGSPGFVMGRVAFGPAMTEQPLTTPLKDVRILPVELAAMMLDRFAVLLEQNAIKEDPIDEKWTPDQVRQIATALKGKR